MSGTDLRPVFPFFLLPYPTRVFDNRSRSSFSSVRPFNSLTTSLFSDYTRGRFTRQLDLGKLSKTESRWLQRKKRDDGNHEHVKARDTETRTQNYTRQNCKLYTRPNLRYSFALRLRRLKRIVLPRRFVPPHVIKYHREICNFAEIFIAVGEQ